MIRSAIFLDRDGVINPLTLNRATGNMESPLQPGDFHLFDEVIPSLLRLQRASYLLVLVSNQPNYALGKSTLESLEGIHQKFLQELVSAGIHFARFSYCFHHPRGVTPGYSGLCVCRKPSPWFLLRARDDFELSLDASWMIGDQPTDIQCGKAAGVQTIRIGGGPSGPLLPLCEPGPAADYSAGNLFEAADIILEDSEL